MIGQTFIIIFKIIIINSTLTWQPDIGECKGKWMKWQQFILWSKCWL